MELFNNPKPIITKKLLCPECGKVTNHLYQGIYYLCKAHNLVSSISMS